VRTTSATTGKDLPPSNDGTQFHLSEEDDIVDILHPATHRFDIEPFAGLFAASGTHIFPLARINQQLFGPLDERIYVSRWAQKAVFTPS